MLDYQQKIIVAIHTEPLYSVGMMKTETLEPRASIFTVEQEAELRRMKALLPFRIIWGSIHCDTQAFECFASFDRREINKRVRSNKYLVATLS